MRSRSFDNFVQKRFLVGFLMVLGIVLLLAAMRYVRAERTDAERPVIGLMTTLPLQWSEGGVEAVIVADAEPHPAYARLSRAYEIRPVDDLATLSSNNPAILLLAQPRAFAPSELVMLDAWLRGGGRALILADPALQWGSLYAIGDKRRPLFTSLLSPLFAHWGLELVLPMKDDNPVSIVQIGDFAVRTQTVGEWERNGDTQPRMCEISVNGIVADCRVGKGRALVVADADFLDTAYWEGQGVRSITGSDEFGNIAWLESLIAALRDGKGAPGDFVGK